MGRVVSHGSRTVELCTVFHSLSIDSIFLDELLFCYFMYLPQANVGFGQDGRLKLMGESFHARHRPPDRRAARVGDRASQDSKGGTGEVSHFLA